MQQNISMSNKNKSLKMEKKKLRLNNIKIYLADSLYDEGGG